MKNIFLVIFALQFAMTLSTSSLASNYVNQSMELMEYDSFDGSSDNQLSTYKNNNFGFRCGY